MKSTTKIALATTLAFSPSAFTAEKCQWIFDKPALLELKLGVRETNNAHRPIGLQVVQSRHPELANAINGLATWALGKTLKMDVINEVAKKFLADTSPDAYFVKLARAFDLRYTADQATIEKNIPAQGPAIVVLNHPRNGSDGIAVAAAISKVRPDTKVAMTLFLENVPGMADNAIFLNPYGGPKAKEFNASRMQAMENHLKKGGLIVIFAAGEVSLKDPGAFLKPADKDWKLGVSRLVQAVPESQVVPVFVGGEATKEFYEVRKKGLGLKTTIFHVRELANNVGRDFPLSFSNALLGKDLLAMFGNDMRAMMQYLRARTYIMSEQTTLATKSQGPSRKLETLRETQDPLLVHNDIASKAQLVFSDPKKAINVYALDGKVMSEMVWHELGIAREKSFRVVGEGSGKSMDIDAYDRHYSHIIAVDTNNNKILGAYRVGRIDQILKEQGSEGIYSANFFEHSALIQRTGAQTLELGRSFVDFEAGSKAIVALDRLWKGVTGFIHLNPHYRYMIGPVSISNAYSTTSKMLMLKYLEKHMDPEMSPLIKGKTHIEFTSQFEQEINIVAGKISDLKELNKIVNGLDGQPIPPLLISYDKLGAKYLAFDRDKDFNTVDGLIIVDLLSKDAAAEASKHFGDKWADYLKHHGMSPAE
jgi:putative hemolysin